MINPISIVLLGGMVIVEGRNFCPNRLECEGHIDVVCKEPESGRIMRITFLDVVSRFLEEIRLV